MKEYNTLNKMNKPIRMMGLSSLQFLAVIVIVGMSVVILVTAGASMIVTVMVFMIEVLPIVLYVSKASKEHKKGNPNFLSSWFMFSSTPRKIIDLKRILSFIK